MANRLSVEKKVAAAGMLCEGNSIRSIERCASACEWGKGAAGSWTRNCGI
jgi:hypothetical protein